MTQNILFIHGLEGTSQGEKATLLRGIFPDILTPDFRGVLEERMAQLREIIGDSHGWTMIGSSFGGLMAAMFACKHPSQVEKLVLLAPALIWPDFAANPPAPIDVPTVIFHGSLDPIIPLEAVRSLAQKVFHSLEFHAVADDHGLYKTIHEIDWVSLLGSSRYATTR
jgi:pimeloyl-ACP methyl ester carboxylesterase